ncbi:MAG: argininosuccinate lyase [Alphaproteobacteria bacterium]|nr:argininosuccinate lyase [Alphaproteobacteria bacterium]
MPAAKPRAKTGRKTAAKTHGGNPMWGGGFAEGPAEAMAAINNSLSFDRVLWREDLQTSRAHVAMLANAGILSRRESAVLTRGLSRIGDEFRRGEFPFRAELEDIHMNIEARLGELVGEDTAGKLHTGRSRNDQAVTDLRLWLRSACDAQDAAILRLQASLIERAEREAETMLPGYTHQQRAQVISLGHWCLSWVEALERDRCRILDARGRINMSPLGAGALAGTGFAIRPRETAAALGFAGVMANSLDAVASRDFALEYLSSCAILSVTLSRFAEELVLWSSSEFGFARFSDKWSSGSSMMPQKRNPDAAELVRGKSGRVVGALTSLLVVTKGLSLAYAKDLQEDKEPLFDATRTALLCLAAADGMARDFTVSRETMADAARGALGATDLADWLVSERGLSFRAAHARVARLGGGDLTRLGDAELRRALGRLSAAECAAARELLTPRAGLRRRDSPGGTAPARVRTAARTARRRLEKARTAHEARTKTGQKTRQKTGAKK